MVAMQHLSSGSQPACRAHGAALLDLEPAVHMAPPSWAVHMVPLPWTWSLPCTWCRSPGPGACCAHGAALLGRAHGAASLDLAHATVDYITMDFM
mmetsp:Transcript_3054/g.6626  ORF Transcript_3054/g.6626 Transcript_3054/m.6626 type:complete len:95 (+) Transcript_3054:19-303(+)